MVNIQKRSGRNRLFYNQYTWCINFSVPGAYFIRSMDEKKSKRIIQWHHDHPSIHGIYLGITALQEHNLMMLLHWFQNNQHRLRITICWSDVSLFTNDRDLLDELHMLSKDKLSFINYLRFSEAVVDMPPRSILRSRSRFRYRSYLREKRVTQEQKDTLRAWLQSQPSDHYQINPAFDKMLAATKWQWYRNSYFVDYKDLSFGTMLSLIVPVRETLSIQRSR